jgi:hypothetical protein
LSEEAAVKLIGKDNIETYLSRYGTLEVAASHPEPTKKIRSNRFFKEVSSVLHNTS